VFSEASPTTSKDWTLETFLNLKGLEDLTGFFVAIISLRLDMKINNLDFYA